MQFVVIGAAIFGVSSRGRPASDTIVLTNEELAVLKRMEAGRRGVSPADPALGAEVDERALEDEILYREGVKLGFDKHDAIVRQRVVQKTLFLAEELAGAAEPPTDAELRRFFEQTRSQWNRPERFHFVHVYARERSVLESLRRDVDARTARGESTASLGQPSPVPADASLTYASTATFFGDAFADALSRTSVGSTFGEPVPSVLGWHLVRVIEHVPGGPASFEDVQSSLRSVHAVKRREDAVAAFLEKSFASYRVEIAGAHPSSISPSRRLALRSTRSAED